MQVCFSGPIGCHLSGIWFKPAAAYPAYRSISLCPSCRLHPPMGLGPGAEGKDVLRFVFDLDIPLMQGRVPFHRCRGGLARSGDGHGCWCCCRRAPTAVGCDTYLGSCQRSPEVPSADVDNRSVPSAGVDGAITWPV
jgi:hypothetical protein